MAVVNLVGPSYTSRATFNSNRELQNWYLENDSNGRYEWILQPTPGSRLFAQTSIGSRIRGLLNYNESLYGVAGDKLFRCNADGVITSLGTLSTTTGRVNIKAIKDQIMVVDGLHGYIYTISTATFGQIVDVDFPTGAATIAVSYGRFVVEQPGSEKFWWSDLRDGTSWDSLSFASAENQTDDLVAVYATGQFLFLCGRFTTELWQNVGGLSVFEPVSGVFIDHGIIAAQSICQVDNSLFWISQNRYGQGLICQSVDEQIKIISNPAISYQLAQYSTLADAFSYTFQMLGQQFVVFTFPTADVTWMYNLNTEQWNKWASRHLSSDGRHFSNCYAHCYGKHLVGDWQSGTILELDPTIYSDGGDRIRRLTRFPFAVEENKRTSIYNFQVDMERGPGLESGQGTNPEISFRFSKDGGHTWGNERIREIGTQGEFRTRVKWLTVGQGDLPYGELVVSDPVYCPIYGATALISSENKDG